MPPAPSPHAAPDLPAPPGERPCHTVRWTIARWLGIALFAALAGGLTTRAMSLYGPGISTDSTEYIRLARDIETRGFAFARENEAVEQPPLYPLLLAGTAKLTGLPVPQAAARLNGLAVVALTGLILIAVTRITPSLVALLLTGVLVCFSIPLHHVYTMAWTEPLFIPLTLLALFIASGRTVSTAACLGAGVLTAGACLTRYAGVALCPALALEFFIFRAGPLPQRLRRLLLYAGPPVLLMTLYVIRNHAVSGTLLGARAASRFGVTDNLESLTHALTIWFLPWPLRATGLRRILVAISLAAVAGIFRRRLAGAIRTAPPLARISGLFFLSFSAFMVWTASATAFDQLNHRLLSPLYPPLLLLFAVFLRPGLWPRRVVAGTAAAGFFLLCLVSPMRIVWAENGRMARDGAGGYNTREWRESALIASLLQNGAPRDARLFSNAPDALYFLANVSADLSPAARRYHSEQGTGLTSANLFTEFPMLDGGLLVWFNRNFRDYLFTPAELNTLCDLTPLRTLDDGVVYRVHRRTTPPVRIHHF